jgi:hypothetical protein
MNRADPSGQLLRVLRRSAAAAGCAVELRHESQTPWASATFTGGQHRITVLGDAGGWLAALPETDLPLVGHFVASCAVEEDETGRWLAILVLEE